MRRRIAVTALGLLVLLVSSPLWMPVPDVHEPASPDEREPAAGAVPDARHRERVRTARTGDAPGDGEVEDEAPVAGPLVIEGEVSRWVEGAEEENQEPKVAGVTIVVRRAADPHLGVPWLSDFDGWEPPYAMVDAPVQEVARVQTGADGRFRVEVEDRGPWEVIASAAGLETQCVRTEADGDLLTITLSAAQSRTFRVVGPDGRAIPGADVAVLQLDNGTAPWVPVEHIRADDGGRFPLAGGNETKVLVRAQGFASREFDDVWDRDDDDLPLVAGTRLAGIIVDLSGAPVPNAVVTHDGERIGREAWKTPADGRFAFEGLDPASDSAIEVYAQGYVTAHLDVAPGDVDVRIVLGEPGEIRGAVLHADESYGPPNVVLLSQGDQTTGARHKVVEDEFVFDDVAPGPYLIHAFQDAVLDVRGLDVRYQAREGRVTLDLEPGELIVGVEVVLEARPISLAVVEVVDAEDKPLSNATIWTAAEVSSQRFPTTNGQGIAALALSLPPGTPIGVSARWSGGKHESPRSGYLATQTVDAAGALPVRMRLGVSKHRVTLAGPDGVPVARGGQSVSLVGYGSTRITAGGTWEVTHPTGVPFSLRVWAKGFAQETVRIEGEALADGAPITIELGPGATLHGRLLANDGSPYAGNVYARPTSGGVHTGLASEVGADGRFELSGAAAGEYLVEARHEDGALEGCWTVDVERGGDHDLGTQRVGANVVRGTVSRSGATSAGGVAVVARNRNGIDLLRTSTAPDGSFSLALPGVPSGHLHFEQSGWAPVFLPIADIEPAKPLHVRLEPPHRLRVRLTPAHGRNSHVVLMVKDQASGAHCAAHDQRPLAWSAADDSVVYELSGLPAGAVEVSCDTADRLGTRMTGSIRAVPSKTDEVTILLAPR